MLLRFTFAIKITNMYYHLKSTHNIWGMLVLFILLFTLIVALIRLLSKKSFNKFSKITALIGLIIVHTQIAFGLLLYFLSPLGLNNFNAEAMKIKISRFYIVEHPIGMILAAILITIGYKKSKKIDYSDVKKHTQILIYYGLGFIIINYLIPWFLWY